MTPARIILGSLVIALALSAAVWLRSTTYSCPAKSAPIHFSSGFHACSTLGGNVGATYKGWHDPLAIFVAIAGLGLGAAIIVSRPRSRASPSS